MVLILGDEKTHLMSFIATCKHATGLLYPTMFVPGLKTLDFNAGPIVTVSIQDSSTGPVVSCFGPDFQGLVILFHSRIVEF